MVEAAKTCHKFNDALHKDFLMEELAKRDMMFLPMDESRAKTWKEIVDFLNTYKVREKSGKPSKFKMTPYRGHKSPIEALCTFENRNDFNSTIVSGDSEGNVFTWNEGVDEDDEDEIEMKNDLILKADGKIVGIKKFNDENNMIVWTIKNKFYIYDVNMYQNENNAVLIITHGTKILENLHVDYVHILVNGKIIKTADGSLAKEIEKNGYKIYKEVK